MILSFHPIITAHRSIICAGREPDATDLAAIQAADAVILPQGCSRTLYAMARKHCPRVFPNLDARFDYPGKIGQTRLFEKLAVHHPRSESYPSLEAYTRRGVSMAFPLVLKLDWGGQGDTVFYAPDRDRLETLMDRVAAFERSGQHGFLLQEWIPGGHRALRVAVIGTRLESYWRIQTTGGRFGTALTNGGWIDHAADPHLQQAGRTMVRAFCSRTGLQLAGFDLIFDDRVLEQGEVDPLMLEINYFFGRQGLGGSEHYYHLLEEAVDAWLAGHALER
jgi:ribosomal protein S6--L-glutamate ligase